MKTITIKGIEFKYEIKRHFHSDSEGYGVMETTYFYKGIYNRTKRKYWLFGQILSVEKPILVFEVDYDIESSSHSKKFIKKILEKEVNKYLKLEKRRDEIKKGKIL